MAPPSWPDRAKKKEAKTSYVEGEVLRMGWAHKNQWHSAVGGADFFSSASNFDLSLLGSRRRRTLSLVIPFPQFLFPAYLGVVVAHTPR